MIHLRKETSLLTHSSLTAHSCPTLRYARGFCKHGPKCRKKHARKELCGTYIAGFCPKGPGLFTHPIHALYLSRAHACTETCVAGHLLLACVLACLRTLPACAHCQKGGEMGVGKLWQLESLSASSTRMARGQTSLWIGQRVRGSSGSRDDS